MTITRDDFILTDEPHKFDVPAIATLLQGTYWAAQRTVEQVAESLTHSTCLVLTQSTQFHPRRVGIPICCALSVTSFDSFC